MEIPEDSDEGLRRKKEGMARAIANAREYWAGRWWDELLYQRSTGDPFTSEDILETVGLPTARVGQHKNNASGALMNAAAKAKLIRKTGEHPPSRRPESHGAETTEWIGLEKEGQ